MALHRRGVPGRLPVAPSGTGRASLRFAFIGSVTDHDASQPLDHGILRTHWLTRDELLERVARLRSPLVLRCIDDYLAGQRRPLDGIAPAGHGWRPGHSRDRGGMNPSSWVSRAVWIRRSRRCCWWNAGCEVQGLFMSNWDEDGCRTAPRRRTTRTRAPWRGCSASRCTGPISRRSIAPGSSTTSWPSIAPAAPPTRMCCATAR